MAHCFQSRFNNQELEKFLSGGGLYGNEAPIHNSNDYHKYVPIHTNVRKDELE